jgi:hypothetical protein
MGYRTLDLAREYGNEASVAAIFNDTRDNPDFPKRLKIASILDFEVFKIIAVNYNIFICICLKGMKFLLFQRFISFFISSSI